MKHEGTVGSQVRIAREDKALTQLQLAMAVQCDPMHISRVERGRVTPSLSLLSRIAKVCGRRLVVTMEPLNKGEGA